jgi:aldehyde dehydrogenase (NAD+)
MGKLYGNGLRTLPELLSRPFRRVLTGVEMKIDDVVVTPLAQVSQMVDSARAAYNSGRTRSVAWRKATLRALQARVRDREADVLAALHQDLGKPSFEAWATEIGFTIADIEQTCASLDGWVAAERVETPMAFQPGSSHIHREPLGVVAVIAPWNYPMQLLLLPAIAAIAAGNAVVMKPSELAPATDRVLGEIVLSLRDPAIAIVHGGVAETTELLAQRFDHIVYTGNSRVARVVMRAAAENLTPVTLELGGKSPAIVSRHADLDVAAKRIAWGKFLNAGQTCIAPDYVLVEASVHDELVAKMAASIRSFYGDNPATSSDYGRIVNEAHFHRLEKLLHWGTVAAGGETDAHQRYIAPTILTGITRDDPPMREEIFGPILPVIAIPDLNAAIDFVNADEKPLALYVFSQNNAENDRVIASATSGGACVNGTILHISNPNLPFGGVGESGMGAYHGKFGFDALSHRRAVHSRTTKLDPSLLYPPYTKRKEAVMRKGLLITDPRDSLRHLGSKLRGRFRR